MAGVVVIALGDEGAMRYPICQNGIDVDVTIVDVNVDDIDVDVNDVDVHLTNTAVKLHIDVVKHALPVGEPPVLEALQ